MMIAAASACIRELPSITKHEKEEKEEKESKEKKEHLVAIVDVGGGTVNATIRDLCNPNKHFVSEGYLEYGGRFYTEKLLEYFVDDIKQQHGIHLLASSS